MTMHHGEGPPPRPTDWNVPNALTVLRVLLVPVYGLLLMHDDGAQPWWRFWAWVVFVVAAVTDGIDGRLARSRGQITNFGKVSDPIADKALMGMAFIGLSLLGEIWWWVTIVILTREIGITLLRFLVIRYGVMPAGRGGKFKTMLQTISLSALTFPLWVLPLAEVWRVLAHVVLGAALVATVLSGVDYVFKAARLRRASAAAQLAGPAPGGGSDSASGPGSAPGSGSASGRGGVR